MQPCFTDFNRFVKSIFTGKVKLIITSFLCCYLFKNLDHFWPSLCFCQELSSCVGLVALGKSHLRKVYSATLHSAMIITSCDFTYSFWVGRTHPMPGKEYIWLFLYLEHGGCLGTISFFPPFLLGWHYVGSSKPNMVWFWVACWYLVVNSTMWAHV